MDGELAMSFDAKVKKTSNVDRFVVSLRFPLDTAKGARVRFVPYVLCAKPVPFGLNGFHRLRDALPNISKDIFSNGSLNSHALECLDALKLRNAIFPFDMYRMWDVVVEKTQVVVEK